MNEIHRIFLHPRTGLYDPNSKIRASVAYTISTIAAVDWPHTWTDLFDIIVKCLGGNENDSIITDQFFSVSHSQYSNRSFPFFSLVIIIGNEDSIHGAMQVLVEFSYDSVDCQVAVIGPVILNEIYRIFESEQVCHIIFVLLSTICCYRKKLLKLILDV